MASQAREAGLAQTLKDAAAGDAQAWRCLVERYAARVYGLIFQQCRDRDLADEITQVTFVRVLEHIGRYTEQGRFEAWLFRIAGNALRDEMRRRRRQARPMDMSEGQSDEAQAWAGAQARLVTDAEDGPLERLAHAEEVQQVQAAVSRLPERDQQVLRLRHTAGLSFPQIAQVLDQPLGTVLARGHRALAKLRKMLAPEPRARK